jgi:hypothetical protein
VIGSSSWLRKNYGGTIAARDGHRSSEFWVLSSELEADRKSGTDEGSRSEFQGFRNVEPRTSDHAAFLGTDYVVTYLPS